jgi:hypothetical protein
VGDIVDPVGQLAVGKPAVPGDHCDPVAVVAKAGH